MLPAQSPALCRRSEGWVLFWFVFPSPFFISPVLFVSLALWVGIAATCWLSDSWADCPLTVPSPEQKGRRGSPSSALNSCFCVSGRLWPFSKPLLPPVGRQELKFFKDCPALQLAAEREWNSLLAQAVCGLLPLLLPCGLSGRSLHSHRCWGGSTGGWEPWPGKARPPALVAVELPHPLLASSPRLSWGLCLS